MYITTPVHTALRPRQTNALSELISNAIGLGNSLLGDLMTSSDTASFTSPTALTPITPISTSTAVSSLSQPSSSPASTLVISSLSASFSSLAYPRSVSSATPATVTTSSTLVSSSSTASPFTTPLSSSHHTDKSLAIALPVVLCFVALALFVAAFWAYRRRKARRSLISALVGEKVKSPYSSSDDDGLHHVPDWHTTRHLLPPPTLPMLDTAYARESPYESMRPAPPTTSPHNPFLLPTENPQHDTSTTTTSTLQQPDVSQESSDIGGTLISPVSPIEMPTELNSDRVRWYAKSSGKHSRPTALWPSRTESSKFDFGFGGRDALGPTSKTSKQQVFKVPRRPIGRL